MRQVLADYEDCVPEANAKLDAMGRSIGGRLIEEFNAKNEQQRCVDFRDTCETIAGVALRMFLGVGGHCADWNADHTSCLVVMETNPLADFVELPERYRDLSCGQMLCGVIVGALEQVQTRATCEWEKDALRGGDGFAMRVTLVGQIDTPYPFDD